MTRILLCYDFSAVHTSEAAEAIAEKLSFDYPVEVVDVFEAIPESFSGFDLVISVISTWHDGSLPPAWDESVPLLERVSFKGKKISFCGLGDPKTYPDFFCNPIGEMADMFELQGGILIGQTAAKDYKFKHSTAQRGDMMVGLCLDYQNDRDKVQAMVERWCVGLKTQI